MRWGGEGSHAGGRFAALAGPLPGSAKGTQMSTRGDYGNGEIAGFSHHE